MREEPDEAAAERDYYPGDAYDCPRCGGDGKEECENRMQCLKEHDPWGRCECPACGGNGRATDTTMR